MYTLKSRVRRVVQSVEKAQLQLDFFDRLSRKSVDFRQLQIKEIFSFEKRCGIINITKKKVRQNEE